MRNLLATIILVMLASFSFAQNYGSKMEDTKNFNDRLKQASERTESIICDFDQVKYMSVLASGSKSKGHFYYKKAQNICLEYTNPSGNMIVMNSSKFKMVNGGKTTVLGLKSNPMMRQLSAMLSACMTGNLSLFGKDAKTEYYESNSHYTVILNPTNSRVKSHLKQVILQFDKRDMTLSTMKMVENETDYTLYEFKDKRINTGVEDSKFKI
jgi:Outer membrane lipoprotein-sorting protein